MLVPPAHAAAVMCVPRTVRLLLCALLSMTLLAPNFVTVIDSNLVNLVEVMLQMLCGNFRSLTSLIPHLL